jgi:peptidoglycan/LPS O-acetylase OafA/YrhL
MTRFLFMMGDRAKRPFVALDILRGVAALTVLLVHVRGSSFVEYGALPDAQRTVATSIFFGATRLGPEAVMLFFVLSGFLVGGQVIERVRRGQFDTRRYAIDRCTRIFLPLVPACLLTAAINIGVFGQVVSPMTLIGNMLGLNGTLVPTLNSNAPLWSLAYEIWFYIAAGAVAFLFTTDHFRTWAVLALCAVCLVFSWIDAAFLLYWVFGGAMILAVGARRSGLLFTGGLVMALAGGVFQELSAASKSFDNVVFIPNHVAIGMLCVGIALMIPWLCSAPVDQRLSRIRSFAHGIAAPSYTIYLTHYPVNCVLDLLFPRNDRLSWQAIGIFSTRVVICISAAAVMYWLFERHTAILRHWFAAAGSCSNNHAMLLHRTLPLRRKSV